MENQSAMGKIVFIFLFLFLCMLGLELKASEVTDNFAVVSQVNGVSVLRTPFKGGYTLLKEKDFIRLGEEIHVSEGFLKLEFDSFAEIIFKQGSRFTLNMFRKDDEDNYNLKLILNEGDANIKIKEEGESKFEINTPYGVAKNF